MPRYRVPFLAAAGVQTDDGRTFETITWRNLPLPLAFQDDTQHSDNATSNMVGQLVELEQGTDSTVTAILDVDPRDANNRPIHDEGGRAASMIERGGQGISIDGLLPIDAVITETCVQEDEDGWCMRSAYAFSEVVVGGATLTPIPAFNQAIVDPTPLGADNQPLNVDEGAGLALGLVASAAAAPVPSLLARAGYALTASSAVAMSAWALDPAHFAEPEGLELASNSINVDADGRVWGWISYSNVCHASFPQACIRSNDQSADLARFLRNVVQVGDERLPVGFLTMDTGHASTEPGTSTDAVAVHYDDTRSIAAIVTAGIRDEGIWFSGSVSPRLDDWQRTVLAAASVSGDWRADYGERLRTLRAGLVVPVPGFDRPALAAAGSCGCGGQGGSGGSTLTTAQTAALARLADRQLDVELVDLDAGMALADLPAAI